jgi:hypothetical protein
MLLEPTVVLAAVACHGCFSQKAAIASVHTFTAALIKIGRIYILNSPCCRGTCVVTVCDVVYDFAAV